MCCPGSLLNSMAVLLVVIPCTWVADAAVVESDVSLTVSGAAPAASTAGQVEVGGGNVRAAGTVTAQNITNSRTTAASASEAVRGDDPRLTAGRQMSVVTEGDPISRWYLLATLPASTLGTYDHAEIIRILGSWVGPTKYRLECWFGNRNRLSYGLSFSGTRGNCQIEAHSGVNGETRIYLAIPGGNGVYSAVMLRIDLALQVAVLETFTAIKVAPSGTKIFNSISEAVC